MKTLRNLVVIAVFLLVFLSLSSATAQQSVELAHDQGRVSQYLYFTDRGAQAVSFSPPSNDWAIQRVRVYGYRFGNQTEKAELVVEIWAMNGSVLYSAPQPFNAFRTIATWVDIDIKDTKVSDPFLVVVYTGSTAERGIYIAYDNSTINKFSEIVLNKRILTDWNEINWAKGMVIPTKERTNWMIRVVGGGGALRPASTQTETASGSTATATTSGTTFFGIGLSTLQGIAGAAGTAGSLVIGWLFKTRKRRLVFRYLTRIDSTYNQYSVDREECVKRLNDMRDEIVQLLKKRQIDEPQYTILESKLTQYLKDLG